jgi:hypothetical protein
MNNSENIMCIFISENKKCIGHSKECYGGFCKKHKDSYLLNDGLIVLDRFTGEITDYKVCDLKNFCNSKMSKCPSKFKKADYFKKLTSYHKEISKLKENIKSIHKIQANIRRYLIYNKSKKRGLAYLNRKICNNDEDFYTYDPINEIESKYFFSYKDNQNNYWGFDIRSLKKLIDMDYDNPYTTEPIPDDVKQNVEQLINCLNDDNIETVINNTIISDRKTLVKQRFVDIFAQMEYCGYSCDVKWILDLNSTKLKRLYRELEDIWNYRANLSDETKRLIVPPNGRLCVMPVSDYYHCHNRLELREILANEVYKICGSSDQGNMNLGFMYFIIALGMVSRPCFMTHNWIMSVF